MSFAIRAKEVKCPNCDYEGKAKIVSSGGGGLLILCFILFIISFFFWPLFIAVGAMVFWMVFRPAKQICPNCKWAHPVPVN